MEKGKGAAFFIRLNNHSEIRRAILESSKDAIMCLQRFERFREIREAKNEAIKQLSNYAIKIEKLSAELEKELPQFDSLDEMIKQSIESPSTVSEYKPEPESEAKPKADKGKEEKAMGGIHQG